MPVFPSIPRQGRYLALGALLLVGVSGCSLVQDRTGSYKEAELASELKIPEWLRSESVAPAYPIPGTGSQKRLSGSSDEGIPEPPDLTANILDENYVVETAGGQSWLLINELPGRVWPSVVRFLSEQGLEAQYENPRIGLLQTEVADFSLKAREWLQLDSEESTLKRLVQARVSPGVRRRTTEVQLRVREVDEPLSEPLQWAPESDYPALEKRLLGDMAEYLKAQEDVKSYSRAALEIAEDPRVKLVTSSVDEPRIELELNFDRAWAEVNRALEEAEVPVVDLNRSAGVWYVDYRGEDERTTGFWFWKSADEPRFTYQVTLERSDGGPLRVTTRQAPDYSGNDRSERLLSEIYENLY